MERSARKSPLAKSLTEAAIENVLNVLECWTAWHNGGSGVQIIGMDNR